jgi:hypothetical protein
VGLGRTDVSEERIATINREKRIGALRKKLAVASNRSISSQDASMASYSKVVPSSLIPATLIIGAIVSSEKSIPTRATRRHLPRDTVLHSHCGENLKSYIALTGWPL